MKLLLTIRFETTTVHTTEPTQGKKITTSGQEKYVMLPVDRALTISQLQHLVQLEAQNKDGRLRTIFKKANFTKSGNKKETIKCAEILYEGEY